MERKRNISPEEIDTLVSTKSEFADGEEITFLMDKPKNLKGRPGKFHPYMITEVERLAKFGMTNQEIADFYDINNQVFTKYVRLYPELQVALYKGREEDGQQLVESLHRQAFGYEVDEVSKEWGRKADGTKFLKSKKVTKKHIQGKENAAIFLLKARFPNKFSETHRIQNETRIDVNINKMDFSNMSFEELMLVKKMGLKNLPEVFQQPNIINIKADE